MKIFEYLLNILSMENELIVVCVVQNKKSNLFQYSSSDEEGQSRRSAVCCTPDLKSLYKIRLNLQCPSTLEGGEGAAEEEEGSKSSPCLNVYPTFLSPLIFGIGSLNTKWGILYLHQYAERRLLVKHFRHTLSALDGVFSTKRSRNKRFSCKRVQSRIINDQISIIFMMGRTIN